VQAGVVRKTILQGGIGPRADRSYKENYPTGRNRVIRELPKLADREE
jgi:hypothetical protein